MSDLNGRLPPHTPDSATHWLLSTSAWMSTGISHFASPNTTLYLLQFPTAPLHHKLPPPHLPYLVTQHIPSIMGSKAQQSSSIHLLPLSNLYQPSHKSHWAFKTLLKSDHFPPAPLGHLGEPLCLFTDHKFSPLPIQQPEGSFNLIHQAMPALCLTPISLRTKY